MTTTTNNTASAMHPGNKATMPFHFWLHDVVMAAIAKGAKNAGEASRWEDMRPRLQRWYQDGMAVWMAADSLAFVAKERPRQEMIHARAEGELKFLAGLIHKANKGGA